MSEKQVLIIEFISERNYRLYKYFYKNCFKLLKKEL